MIRFDGQEYASIDRFDCHVLSFNHAKGGGYTTVLPISNLDYRQSQWDTGASVKVEIGDTSTKFHIVDDCKNISIVEVDNTHSDEIVIAIVAAHEQRLLEV